MRGCDGISRRYSPRFPDHGIIAQFGGEDVFDFSLPPTPRVRCAGCITKLRRGKPEGSFCDCCERKVLKEVQYKHDGRRNRG